MCHEEQFLPLSPPVLPKPLIPLSSPLPFLPPLCTPCVCFHVYFTECFSQSNTARDHCCDLLAQPQSHITFQFSAQLHLNILQTGTSNMAKSCWGVKMCWLLLSGECVSWSGWGEALDPTLPLKSSLVESKNRHMAFAHFFLNIRNDWNWSN